MAESAILRPEESLPALREQFLSNLPERVRALDEALIGLRARPESSNNRRALLRRLKALREAAQFLGLEPIGSPLTGACEALDRVELSDVEFDEVHQVLAELAAVATSEALTSSAAKPCATASEASPLQSACGARSNHDDTATTEASRGSVLFFGSHEAGASLRESLSERGLELIVTCDVDEALSLVARDEPPLVVMDTRLVEFEQAMATLSRECAVLGFGDTRLMRRATKAGARGYAASKVELLSLLQMSSLDKPEPSGPALPVGALVEQLAEELRTALETAAGEEARLSSQTLEAARAVTWGAIAKLREVISEGSEGSVDYGAEGPEGALVASRRRHQDRTEGDHSDLKGRKVLVADDDPAVTWFVASALAGVGARVVEASDGLAAWELAQSEEPDLVVSDVLMPRLDGFALCRALKRDVALSTVPVVLLSWKEDLLQRVRELGALADGYVSKDTQATVILDRCAEALRPKAQIERRLAAGGVVHGRLDDVTPKYILGLVAKGDSDAIVEFCDAGFVYEAHFARGRLVAAQRRSAEGTVRQGENALLGLLGVRAGRFIVRQGELLAPNLQGSLGDILGPQIARIRAACQLVQTRSLYDVEELELDDGVLGPYLTASPPVVRKLVNKLSEGVPPSLLLKSVTSNLLQDVLEDLAIRGAIRRARDVAGRDLLSEICDGVLVPPDADLETPLPGALVERAQGAPSVGAGSTTADVERAVIFADSLRANRVNSDVVSPQWQTPESPSACKPESGDSTRLDRLRERLQRTMSDKSSTEVELSQAVLVGLSLTPALPGAGKRSEAKVNPKPTVSSERPAAAERCETDEEQPPTRRIRSATVPSAKALTGTALPGAGTRFGQRTLNALVDGVQMARQRANKMAVSSRAWWAERRTNAVFADDEFSEPLVLAERKQGREGTIEGVHSSPEAEENRTEMESARSPALNEAKQSSEVTSSKDGEPAAPIEAKEFATTSAAGATPSPSAEVSDADATDPDWLPPVDTLEPPQSARRHSSRSARQKLAMPAWGRRVAVPLALVTCGGYAAFSLVGALSSSLPAELLEPQAVNDAPELPAEVPGAVASVPQRSAAMELLEQARSNDDPSVESVEAVRPANDAELISYELPLPDGIELSDGDGWLEVNTGDKHKIYVGGVFVGRGPARRIRVPAGSHTVTTRLSGSEHEYAVKISAGKRTRLGPAQRTAGR